MADADAPKAPGAATRERRRHRLRNLPLVGALAVALAVELVFNRLGAHLIQLEPLAPLGRLRSLVDVAGLFSFHFASVLAVLLAALGLLRLLAQPLGSLSTEGRLPQALGRTLLVVATVGFVFVAVLGVGVQLPTRLRIYLLTLFLLLLLYVVRFALRLPTTPARARLWLLLFAVAALLHSGWVAAVAFERESLSSLPRLLLSVGEALAVTLAAIVPACFPSAGTRRQRLTAAALGLSAGGAAAALGLLDWSWAARVTAYGFGLELPFPTVGVALYALAMALWLGGATALLLGGGTARLRGWGLLIVGLAGYHLELPYQLASSIVGLLCIADSYSRELDGWLSATDFRALLRRVASWAGAVEVTAVGAAGWEQAHMRAAGDGAPVEVTVSRRAGMLAVVEVVVGRAPADEPPPLSLLRRGAPRLGRKSGIEVALGDERFDRAFVVHDARVLRARDPVLGDDALRAGLLASADGWLGVWPAGVRFRSASPALLTLLREENGSEKFRELLAVLVELHRASSSAKS
jgi:hypothetical protein